MKLSKKIAILATALISFAFISCDTDTDDSKPPAESSGSTEAGGSGGTGAGGSTEAGGSAGTGGSTEAGGGTGTGGSTESGGSGETGGSTGSGGAGETGGSTEPGGTTGSGGSGETGGSTGSGGESEGNPVLPGIKGGTGNEKDTFAGKIFYGSVEKDTAESYTKYAFSTEGTVEISEKYSDDEKATPKAVINYSFSKDYKIVYMTYNKILNPIGYIIGNNDKLYTYTEFEQYLYNDAAKEMLDYLNNIPDSDSGEQKKVMKDYTARTVGLDSYTTDEELLAAMQKYSKEHAEEILTPICKTFDTVFQYDLSTDEEDRHPILTEKNTWGKDLSKFISLQGSTYYQYYYSEDHYFDFSYSNGDFYGYYADGKYSVTKVDSSKIYFESSDEEGNTTKLEASYTISDDDKTLTLTIDGKTIEAKLDLDQIDLYQ